MISVARSRVPVLGGFIRGAMLAVLALAAPAHASADWLLTPFVGSVFGGDTNIVLLSQSAGDKKFTFGGAFSLLSSGVLGAEAEVGHTPRFFSSSKGSLVLHSTVTTASGSLIAAVPIAITGYSLRPYVVGGVGLMHASSRDLIDFITFDRNLLALNLGGGAIGFLSNKTGVRFELRQFRNLTRDNVTTTNFGRSTRLSFWRATVGVVLRY